MFKDFEHNEGNTWVDFLGTHTEVNIDDLTVALLEQPEGPD